MASVLVTGAAGFIGYHLSQRLLARGDVVVGLDNLNNYYDVRLKQARLALLQAQPGFQFAHADLADQAAVNAAFEQHAPRRVVNLAAQAGVRHSLTHPHAYTSANIVGFLNILEACRHSGCEHLVFASSSSVYGANTRMPFSEHDNVDHPLSLYAASKKANELMAHSYAHLYGIPCTGLRFFNVYGPWGRPDGALWIFTKAILEERPINVFNYGQHRRDFTYVADIAEGVMRVLDRLPPPNPDWDGESPDPASSRAPYRLYNIGNDRPVELMHVIALLERLLGREARKNFLPMQPGDVPESRANIDALMNDVGFRPSTSIEEGVAQFVDWYREYHRA